MKIEIKKLEKSEVQFDIVMPSVDFEKYHDKGFKKIQEVVSVDGFRKGNAPEDAVIKNYGDMIILEEMANLALRDAYMEAIKEHKIIPVADRLEKVIHATFFDIIFHRHKIFNNQSCGCNLLEQNAGNWNKLLFRATKTTILRFNFFQNHQRGRATAI